MSMPTKQFHSMQERVAHLRTIILADMDKEDEIRKKYQGFEYNKRYQMLLELKELHTQTESKLCEVLCQVDVDAYHKLQEVISCGGQGGKRGWGRY